MYPAAHTQGGMIHLRGGGGGGGGEVPPPLPPLKKNPAYIHCMHTPHTPHLTTFFLSA